MHFKCKSEDDNEDYVSPYSGADYHIWGASADVNMVTSVLPI